MASQFPPKRILIVDDNRDNADLTAQLLKLHGHATYAAYGGKEGVEAAIRFVPDIILLDLGMPDIDGFSVALTLRQMQRLDQSVLIAYTAWSDVATRTKASSCGFDMHIVKPARIHEILAVIATAQRKITPM